MQTLIFIDFIFGIVLVGFGINKLHSMQSQMSPVLSMRFENLKYTLRRSFETNLNLVVCCGT